MRTPPDLIKLVNASGVPLQLAVEREVQRSNNWTLLHREHAWTRQEHRGFADLVIASEENTVAVVECKRVRDSDWVFIVPKDAVEDLRSRIYVVYTLGFGGSFTGFYDARTWPASYESEFCVMVGDDAKSRLLLERPAADIVNATEAIALEEFEQRLERVGYGYRAYISVIVTTARLSVCAVDEDAINLATGETEPSSAVFTVPWVRFRKQLTDEMVVVSPEMAWDPKELSRSKEKVVFVVNAAHLSEFLDKWSVSDQDVERLARRTLAEQK